MLLLFRCEKKYGNDIELYKLIGKHVSLRILEKCPLDFSWLRKFKGHYYQYDLVRFFGTPRI